ncbi:MAG: NfeD family protein [Planctomycetota bacterium]|nr:NfeD family protein [Planctomycetota bacterium]
MIRIFHSTPGQKLPHQQDSVTGSIPFALGLLAAWLCCSLPDRPGFANEFPRQFERATIIHFEGEITQQQFKFFESKLKLAERRSSDLVIIVIDSPGGLLQQSLSIGERLRDVDWATTIAYIPQKAISGAAIFSLGCDRIVMGENARLGDAGVIELNENFLFQYVEAKLLTDVVRQVRDLATSKSRSPDLAEALVDRSAVVYQRTAEDGESPEFKIQYAEKREDGEVEIEPEPPASADGEPPWTIVPETRGNRFLEVNAAQGIALGLCEETSTSLDEFLGTFQISEPPLQLRRTTADSVIFWLNYPAVTFLLIVVGLVALYFEFSAPGISVGGLVSGLCFVLFFWSRFLGGTAGLLEILLFISGIIFLLMELFVIPGFGLSGILGALLMIASIVMASQTFVVPQNSVEVGQLSQSLAIVMGSFLTFLFCAWLISRKMGMLPVFNRLILSPPEIPTDSAQEHRGGKPHPMVQVGEWGVTESVLRPAGKARFQGRSIDVVSDGAYVESGASIQIVEISGNRVMVCPEPDAGSNDAT